MKSPFADVADAYRRGKENGQDEMAQWMIGQVASVSAERERNGSVEEFHAVEKAVSAMVDLRKRVLAQREANVNEKH